MKSKTGSKLTRYLMTAFGIYISILFVMMTVLSGEDNTKVVSDNYDKRSIDNTPEFILTDKSNGCRYIYDSVQKTSYTDTGSTNCAPLH